MSLKVFLIPTPLYNYQSEGIDKNYYLKAISSCSAFFTEHAKNARRLLKTLCPQLSLADFEWIDIHHNAPDYRPLLYKFWEHKKHIGILSDAGCPGIADPGADIVQLAQQKNIEVLPLIGPSALLLALMGSGLNGQHFTFHGYLPITADERLRTIKILEKKARRQSTQLFIETPYRNTQLYQFLITHLHPDTRLCIACHLCAPEQWIRTQNIGVWQRSPIPELYKKPCVFLLG